MHTLMHTLMLTLVHTFRHTLMHTLMRTGEEPTELAIDRGEPSSCHCAWTAFS
jgi:hypothetical protein